MKHIKLSIWLLLVCISFSSLALTKPPINKALKRGIQYLESVQLNYGEFPTLFYPNLPEPKRSLYSSFDSNLFTSAMISDALSGIANPQVKVMNQKVASFIKSQLNNDKGLWSYFTTHNAAPLYPNKIYDLDDTVFASMVLKQQGVDFPDNKVYINANKDSQGLYLTFIHPPFHNDIDCGVNANVLSYLQEQDEKICEYLNYQVTTNTSCAHYYEQRDAYYLISRAYASGISCLAPSVTPLIDYSLKQFNKNNGSVDDSAFKTAIVLNTLLDVGYQGKEVEKAIAFLLKVQSKTVGSWQGEDFWLWAGTDEQGNTKILGRSNSSALTTAIVLKALARRLN